MVEREKGSSERNNTQGCGQNGLNAVYFFMGHIWFPYSFPVCPESLKFCIVHRKKRSRALVKSSGVKLYLVYFSLPVSGFLTHFRFAQKALNH